MGTKFNVLCLQQNIVSNSKVIYSTDDSFSDRSSKKKIAMTSPSLQKVRLHLDRKGGGKIVSVVRGLSESVNSLNQISKELKKACGVGGSVKNGEILIQGNKRDIIQNILLKKGYEVKLSGG